MNDGNGVRTRVARANDASLAGVDDDVSLPHVLAIASIKLPLQQWHQYLLLISQYCTSDHVHVQKLGSFVPFNIL